MTQRSEPCVVLVLHSAPSTEGVHHQPVATGSSQGTQCYQKDGKHPPAPFSTSVNGPHPCHHTTSFRELPNQHGQMKSKSAASAFSKWIYWSKSGKSLQVRLIHTCCSNLYKKLWFIIDFFFFCTPPFPTSHCALVHVKAQQAVRSWHALSDLQKFRLKLKKTWGSFPEFLSAIWVL